jgi:hypothetical protein
MSFFSQHKLIAIVLIIVVLFGAWYALSGSSVPAPALTTTPLAGASTADQTLIATLLQLRSVKLDGTIFSDPAFAALQDFSTPIVSEPVGRPNPFAPLQSAVATPAVGSVQNGQIFTPHK